MSTDLNECNFSQKYPRSDLNAAAVANVTSEPSVGGVRLGTLGHFLGGPAYLPPQGDPNFVSRLPYYLEPAKIPAAVASRC